MDISYLPGYVIFSDELVLISNSGLDKSFFVFLNTVVLRQVSNDFKISNRYHCISLLKCVFIYL